MTGSVPQHGDIVIRESSRDGKTIFVLSTVPCPDQIILRTREEALRQARLFANRESVRVWLANGESEVTLLNAEMAG